MSDEQKPIPTDEDWEMLRDRLGLPQPGPGAMHA